MKILFQLIFALFIINLSFAQVNYYVSSSGSDANDGSQASPWATIEYAVNNVSNPSVDEIIINISTGVYDLSNDQIDIDRNFVNLTLVGEGSDNTFIQAAADTSLSSSRVIKVYSGNNVSLTSLTIRYGRVLAPEKNGGGIFNEGGTLIIDYCLVTENRGGVGGGVSNNGGNLTIKNSTISYNVNSDNSLGAGIGSTNGTLSINNSTISYNSANFSAGIFVASNGADAIFNMENSTVYGNIADSSFGGIRITIFGTQPSSFNVITNINSCTITNNSAVAWYGGIGLSAPSNFNIKNSIVAANTVNGSPNDLVGSVLYPIEITSGGYNIIQSVRAVTINGDTNNGIGLDPLLLPLSDNNSNNGTQTCAIPGNSPAKDQIPAISTNGAPLFDQRGYTRVGDFDIGAYEYPGQRARVQIVHNSADVLTDTVDVYINDALALDNFAFRSATPFIDLPADETLNIGFALPTSTSVNDTVKNFPVVLNPGETYVVFANGVLDTSLYESNPDGKSTEFTLFVKDMALETAAGSDVDFFVLHGSTDAPTVDVKVRELGSATIVDDAAYGDITPYLTAPAQSLTLDLYLDNGINYVASFTAPLTGLDSSAIVVFASGFLDSAANQNGAAFGLFAALSNGTVVKLPAVNGPTARVQVIHNSADVLADTVDVYVNDALAIPDFAFRTATPFIDLPAGVTLNIGVAPGNSSSVNDTLANFPFILSADEKYVVFANGVLDSSLYQQNPDGKSTEFNLFVKDMALETAAGSDVDFFVLHGITDVPAIEVRVRELGNAVIIDSLSYGDLTPYITAPAQNLTLDIYTADGTSNLASLEAPLAGLGGKSLTVFASGFGDTSANQNGPEAGLYAAYADGTVIMLNPAPPTIITIAEAREDLNSDLIPDRLGETVTIKGVVLSPNYQTANHSYYIWDGTAGITEIIFGTTNPVLNLGDSVQITGVIGQFRGLTQIQPADSSGIVLINSGNPVPGPIVLTVAQYVSDPEAYEGTLVGFASVNKISGTWGGNQTLKVSDGTDTLDLRIDSDTDLDNNPEPSWPVDIIGLASQFSSPSSALDNGYQILPRYYATDVLPAGTIPVELISFTASYSKNNVTLTWATATETNNQGFEVERKSVTTNWTKIGFVPGFGTTTEARQYSFTDNNIAPGSFSYRLKQVDFDGSFEYSDVVNVNVTAPVVFALEQNYPNPFNPSTLISYSIPQNSFVTLKVYDILGNEVATLVNQTQSAGKYDVRFDATNLSNGVYIYSIKTENFTSTKKMIFMK
jgi:DNA/RNA endonuclease YhcR with UshA esterase domain